MAQAGTVEIQVELDGAGKAVGSEGEITMVFVLIGAGSVVIDTGRWATGSATMTVSPPNIE